MEFGKEQANLEEKLNGKDLFEEIDAKFIKDESASQTIIKRMFLTKGLVDKSDLDLEEIPNIAKLLFVSKKFDLPSGIDLTNIFLALRISKDRLGRTEGFSSVSSENEVRAKGQQPVISLLGGKMPTL